MNFKITANHIAFSYEKNNYVFQDLSFSINDSEIFSIVGRNGSGKTTLLNCLSSYYSLNKGDITLHDEKIKHFKQKMGHITSNIDLIRYLTINENIQFFLNFNKIPFNEEKTQHWLKRYSLLNERSIFIENCSDGMKKKVQIILAFLMNPLIILADEPFNSLDKESRKILTEDFKNFAKEGSTVIIVNHDLDWVKNNSDKIFSMDEKKFILANSA